jgi:magnesium-transporting ATPase (P-type)
MDEQAVDANVRRYSRLPGSDRRQLGEPPAGATLLGMGGPPPVLAAASESPTAPRGLSAAEAARRLARVGPNEVASGRRLWVLRTLLGLVGSPLVLILLAASIVSGLLGESLNAGLIGAMIALSVGLDFVQVFRSQQAAARLRGLVAPTASVWRDGRLVAIPVRELVPGDAVDVSAGDLLPADAQVIEATTLLVDEAALTGESLPSKNWCPRDQLGCSTPAPRWSAASRRRR